MIAPVQTSQVVLPARTTPTAAPQREAASPREAAAPARAQSTDPSRFGVEGRTLVAAQEEASQPKTGRASELSEADREKVRELQARDREVRAHEQAHARVGGQHAGAPQYEFERGPDGKSYAVAGSVSISTAPVPGDPEATVRKMDQVKRAALAPAEPSGQDRRVAADADAKRADARAELNATRRDEMQAEFEGVTEAPAPEEPVAGADRARAVEGFQTALDRAREALSQLAGESLGRFEAAGASSGVDIRV